VTHGAENSELESNRSLDRGGVPARFHHREREPFPAASFVETFGRSACNPRCGAVRAPAPVPPPVSNAASFAELPETAVPGRYRIADDGGKVMSIVLNEDHTFINEDGTTYLQYQWEVSPDGLTITWQRSSTTFNIFEKPGTYSRTKTDGTVSRMQKLPDLPPADTISFDDKDVVGSLRFTADIQAQGLAVAHIDGDGAIQPGDAGGEECHHLIRSRSRMSAFLYVRIAPELKTEPFTNAYVVVEYFDSPARDPRNGWITLQYDARDGPYTSTAQRIKLKGSMKWTRATFVLDTPVFTGRQNDTADFRVCVANPDLSVRALKLVKNQPLPSRTTTEPVQ
jgi:hypothetical protein